MKNTMRKAATEKANKKAAIKNRLNFKRLKNTLREMLTAFFIYVLVFVPLLSVPGVIQNVQAQIAFCDSAENILQGCPLGNNGTETALTNQAIDDVLALYELPSSERANVKKHARNEIRAMIYVRLLELINKQNPTATEQQSIAVFTQRIKDKRIEAAQKAKAEYNRFQSTNCRIYQPPSPYTYNPGYGCYSNFAGSFSGPKVPSYEEFQNFGSVLAYGDLIAPEAQNMTTQTTQGIVAGAGIAAAGIGAGAAAAIGSTITFGTLSAILPAAGVTFTLSTYATGAVTIAIPATASAASGSIGASAAAGPAAIIILALTAAVMEGINVANQSQLPGKLDQAIIDKQNETIDIRSLINGDDAQKQEVYGAFLRLTLPEYPDEEAITPSADNPIFTVSTGTGAATDANLMTFQPWDNNASNAVNEARLSGRSWFLVRNNNSGNSTYRMRLSINYQGENGELLTARRRGREFIITRPENPAATVVTDTLKVRYQNTVYTYKVKPSNPLAVAGNSRINVDCFYALDPESTEQYNLVRLGRILNTGGTPTGSLILTVNGGAAATVGNITLKNISIQQDNGTNYITGRVVAGENAFGEAANFTIKVENNAGDTQTFLTTVKKTATIDTLPAVLPVSLDFGANYTFELSTNRNAFFLGECAGFSYSMSGELPSGFAFVNNHPNGANEPGNSDVRIVGTAASDGDYQFTINKIYTNGERLSRTYRITVRAPLAEIPGGLKSWWRAENNAEDFANRANGTMNGSATFINSKVARGFYFRGTNGYVALPDNAFQIASQSQTFETWFKTRANGVILGRQSGGITPYGNAQNISRPLLYVDRAGKLHSTFGSSEVVSPSAVNNNSYHHVAVTFSESGGGAVYLDGVSIGANNGRAFTGANQKFQFGTGFVYPGASGELSGWSNFTGTIDEAAIYDQILSVNQIKAIYAAGAGGKTSVSAIATPPTQRDGSTGTITIDAQGGVRQLKYSINNGATFQTTNFFQNLTPGTYQIVVRDGGNRDVRRTVTINNPAPSLSFTTEVVPPQCFGGNARVTIFPSGGSDNYEYSVRNGANIQTSNVFTDIGAGTHTPWIRDVVSDTTYTNGTINIAQPSEITVSPASFPNAALNQPYSRTFTISGGTPGYSIGISGDVQTNFQLPAGLTSTVSGNTFTISGTPTQTGTFRLFFEIYDQNNCRQGIFAPPLTITSNQTYGIAGRATNGDQPLANVTITLAGAENRTTTTDANGNYSFSTVAGSADYTVTATLTDATFAQPTIALNNLSANLSNTDFALSPVTYEGDFAPRRSGDGLVNVIDLIALGRTLMSSNPDPLPANGSEFQRADSNPPNNLGDGAINTNDLAQIRTYILGTPKFPSGGAIAPASPPANQATANEKSFFATPELDLQNLKVDLQTADATAADAATVSAGTAASNGSGDAIVPIRLTTNGNVQAAQFTINFDANRISVASITNLAPANTTFLTNNFATGKITVVVNQPINGTAVFPNGTFDLLRIAFTPRTGSVGFARVDFGDAPTQLIASDPQANPVTLNSSPGGVSINAGPTISGRVMNGGQGLSNVTVSRTSGSQTVSTVTDASGNYYFDNLSNGSSYTIRAVLNGYTFTPATLSYNNLNASFTNADFNTSQTTYEGDIAGRPTGDGAVNVQDLVQIGRMIGGLDATAASGGEWQRTDVAPQVSRGDGAINVQDLVQLGRYAGNLDAPVPANGAINSAQPSASANQEQGLTGAADSFLFGEDAAAGNLLDRLLTDLSTKASAENLAPAAANLSVGTATVNAASALVPIKLNSNADTAAIQFTVNYDPAKLSIPNDAAIVNRYPNTTFIINRNTPGKLGIVAYQPLDGATVFPAGEATLFNINFTVANGAGGATAISFGSDPVPTAASNQQAGSVSTAAAPATITLLSPTAANVSLGGRVFAGTRGLSNATIYLTDQTGTVRAARTNPFGYYRFAEVPAGSTCILTVISKRYTFASQIVNITGDIDNLNFVSEE